MNNETELAIKSRACTTALDWNFDSVFAPVQIAVQEFAKQREHLSTELLSSTIKGMLVVY